MPGTGAYPGGGAYPGATPGAGGPVPGAQEEPESQGPSDDDVVDADYEVVDDEDK